MLPPYDTIGTVRMPDHAFIWHTNCYIFVFKIYVLSNINIRLHTAPMALGDIGHTQREAYHTTRAYAKSSSLTTQCGRKLRLAT